MLGSPCLPPPRRASPGPTGPHPASPRHASPRLARCRAPPVGPQVAPRRRRPDGFMDCRRRFAAFLPTKPSGSRLAVTNAGAGRNSRRPPRSRRPLRSRQAMRISAAPIPAPITIACNSATRQMMACPVEVGISIAGSAVIQIPSATTASASQANPCQSSNPPTYRVGSTRRPCGTAVCRARLSCRAASRCRAASSRRVGSSCRAASTCRAGSSRHVGPSRRKWLSRRCRPSSCAAPNCRGRPGLRCRPN